MNANHFDIHIQRYLQWLHITNHSPRTAKTRKSYLQKFIDWSSERGLDTPNEITLPIIERYQRFLYQYRKSNGEPLSVNVQYNHLAAIKAFFRYLTKERYILYNPASDIDLPKKIRRLPRTVLNQDEITTVINQADTNDDLGIRDRAIMETFYSTGIRRMELINLNIYDISPQQHTVLIREGKGMRDRVVPIGNRALAWIQKYQSDVRPELITDTRSTTLFLNKHGEALKPNRLSALMRHYINQADLGKSGSCHVFRHSMATHMLDNGADTRYIQLILGHQQLETTQVYTHVSISQLIDIHEATHPAKQTRSISSDVNIDADELLDALAQECDD